jgi:hypothetical protein
MSERRDDLRRLPRPLRWFRCPDCGTRAPTRQLLERHQVRDCHGLPGWRRKP